MTVADLADAAEAALEQAVADAEYAREKWDDAGRPLEQTSGNGMAGVHPLRKALVEADDRVARRRLEVVKFMAPSRRGRPPGSVSSSDRVAAPKVELKAV